MLFVFSDSQFSLILHPSSGVDTGPPTQISKSKKTSSSSLPHYSFFFKRNRRVEGVSLLLIGKLLSYTLISPNQSCLLNQDYQKIPSPFRYYVTYIRVTIFTICYLLGLVNEFRLSDGIYTKYISVEISVIT